MSESASLLPNPSTGSTSSSSSGGVISCTRLGYIHGTIGIGAHLAILLYTVAYSGLGLSAHHQHQHFATTSIAVLIIMTELGRHVVNRRHLKLVATTVAPAQPYAMRMPAPRQSSCIRLATLLLLLMLCTALAFAICILFGAPLLDNHPQTLTLAIMLVAISVMPLLLFAGPQHTVQYLFADQFKLGTLPEMAYLRMLKQHALCGLFGAWASSACSVLDWDRDWQVYPVPNIYGALLGLLVGNGLTFGGAIWRTAAKWYRVTAAGGAKRQRRQREMTAVTTKKD